MMVVKAKVRRDGELVEVPMDQLVPGDIVNIEAGDLVPADARILTAATLEIDESALTGESVPTPKQVGRGRGRRRPRRPRRHGVHELPGHARRGHHPRTTGTGMATEVGHISGMLQATTVEKTPLTKQLDALTNQILIIAGLALLASIAIGLYRGTPFEELFLTAVAFAVAAIPTGLPAVVTAILSKGSQMLAGGRRDHEAPALGRDARLDLRPQLRQDRHAHAQPDDRRPDGRRRPALRDLRRRLLDRRADHPHRRPARRPARQYLLPMALCADAEVRDGALVGDPTEGALVVLAAKGGVDPTLTREQYPRVATLPFDAAYKMMATFHRMKDATGKDVIRALRQGRAGPAPRPRRQRPRPRRHGGAGRARGPRRLPRRERAPRHAGPARHGHRPEGLRPGHVRPERRPAAADRDGLTLLAIVGIVDPPRPAAQAAIATAHAAGIQVRMITGDHAVTARGDRHASSASRPRDHRRRVRAR